MLANLGLANLGRKRWLVLILVTIVLQTGAVCAQNTPAIDAARAPDELLDSLPATIALAQSQYQLLLRQSDSGDPSRGVLRRLRELVRPRLEQPRTWTGGQLKLVPPEDWTSGFFAGALWHLFELTGEPSWQSAAQRYTRQLEQIKHFRGHHDIGFMLKSSYGNGWRLTRDLAYRDVLLQGARSLVTRFNPKVGLIRSWDFGPWQYPVIVDNLMNLELLTWAARQSDNASMLELAVTHAENTIKHHYRSDASSVHLVDFDPASGAVLKKQTVQGAADTSSWARGQAWGLYGYTMMYRETRRPKFLEQAQRIARFILEHPRLPADKVPYWDFDAPDIPNTSRDSSAAAIIAAALLELSNHAEPPFAAQLREFARQQLLSLSSPAYLAKPGENGGFLLKRGVGSRPGNTEVDAPLIYGDYYFLEALLRYRKSVL